MNIVNTMCARPVTDLVTMLGGVNDTVVDVFGEDMRVCRADHGVDSVLRYSLLRHRLATILQPPWVPAFTGQGWRVEEVPARLLGMINIARMQALDTMEEESCIAEVSCFNCQTLVQDKKECKLPQHSQNQLIITLSPQLKASVISVLKIYSEILILIFSCKLRLKLDGTFGCFILASSTQ